MSFGLRCLEGRHPDLALAFGERVLVGRGPATRVKDKRLSRHHLALTAQDHKVDVTNVGGNASSVAGRLLRPGQTAFAVAGDVIELLEGQYPHVVVKFGKPMAKRNDGNEAKVKSVKPASKRDSVKPKSHWSNGLLAAMKDPSSIVDEDEVCVAIKDKYPKSRHHFLVLPKEDISSLAKVGKEHLATLKHLQSVGEKLAVETSSEAPFRLGYHAVASMQRLHLHVISQDFDSPCLKTKKHWNSFTTDFFVSSADVLTQVDRRGHWRPPEDAKAMLDSPLKCHLCCYHPKNMPELKNHLRTHCQNK